MMRPIFVALILALSVGLSDAARTTYTFSISGDTSNGVVNPRVLQDEIISSAITTTPVYINTANGSIDIVMSSQLTGARATTLTNVVAVHKDAPTRSPVVFISLNKSSNQPFASVTDVHIIWDNVLKDLEGDWVTNSFIVPYDDEYLHECATRISSLTDGKVAMLRLYTNGVEVIYTQKTSSSSSGALFPTISRTLYHSAGDVVILKARHNTAGTQNIDGNVTYTQYTIRRIIKE